MSRNCDTVEDAGETAGQEDGDDMRTKRKPQVGDVRRFDYQADAYESPYELVEDLGGGRWLCRYAELTDEDIDRYDAFPASEWVDPVADFEDRVARIGETFEVRFITHAQWAAAF